MPVACMLLPLLTSCLACLSLVDSSLACRSLGPLAPPAGRPRRFQPSSPVSCRFAWIPVIVLCWRSQHTRSCLIKYVWLNSCSCAKCQTCCIVKGFSRGFQLGNDCSHTPFAGQLNAAQLLSGASRGIKAAEDAVKQAEAALIRFRKDVEV